VAGALKTATFTVHATQAQSERWKRAAEADGHRSAGTWLAEAADCYLKARARAGRQIPLAWRRFGHFEVQLSYGLVTVPGRISKPFGAFRGDAYGPKRGGNLFVLVYIPTAEILATLRSFQQCKALASELAPVLLRGDPPPPAGGIVERHQREAK
jgi:hypothetical protein